MKPVHLALFSVLCLLSSVPLAAAPACDLSETGALTKLSASGDTLTFAPGGGFSAREVTAAANKPIDLSRGTLAKSGDKTTYTATSPADGITLQAQFTPNPAGYIQVDGFLENTSSATADRAIILDYRVCLPGDNLVFSSGLNDSDATALSKIKGGKTETESNAFPLAALASPTAKTAVSMAIPWNEPRTFGMVGSGNSMMLRLYLGISPLPKLFPNKAAFSFIIYPSRPDWGFRGSLEKYYCFYPDRYEPHSKEAGFYMYMEKGNVPAAATAGQFAYNVLEMQNPNVPRDLDRNEKYNIATLVYTIVGQREVKFLPKIPANYDEAMKAFANWKLEDNKPHPLTKEIVASEGDAWLREEIENSAVKDPAGKYVILMRNTGWGKNSATFKVNPSPFLFDDKPEKRTVGKDSFATIDKWLAQNPRIKGVIVDSLGAKWPAVANYSKDHMPYAQYPLTFDAQGRLFMHNETAHYEWVRAMRDKLAPQNRLTAANGIYAYATNAPEHYRAAPGNGRIKVGRFFIASLLDTAASETEGSIRIDRCQDARLMMGRKYYALTNYKWNKKDDVEHFYNRSLAWGIFATNNRDPNGNGPYEENINEGKDYWANPKGYYRDKPFLDWFLSRVRLLHKAGWEPVTLARQLTPNNKVYIERFGNGAQIYFTVLNDSSAPIDFAMKLDLAALGLADSSPTYKELAQNAKLELAAPDEIRLKLAPFKTYIVSATKK